jgi:hypothetical protein
MSGKILKPEAGAFSPVPRQLLSGNRSKPEPEASTLKTPNSVRGSTHPKPRQERKIGHDARGIEKSQGGSDN